jgi:hypothetical protein
MNKITILLLLITTPLFAQIEKGNSYVWGNATVVNFHSSGSGYSANNFAPNLNLNYGKFTKDGLMLGYSVGWLGAINRNTSSNSGYTQSQNFNTIQFGLFGRKYFKAIPRLYPYAGAGLKMAISKNVDTQNNGNSLAVSTDKKGGWSLLPQFQLGFSYLVSPRISMVLGTTSNVYPISFYGLEMGLNYSLNPQKLNSKVVVVEQTDAKNWLVGVGISTSGYSNDKEIGGVKQTVNNGSSSVINLSSGRFVKNGLLVGMDLKIGLSRSTDDIYSGSAVASKSSATTIGLRPFIKKYLSRNRLLSPYWQGGISYEQTVSGSSKTRIYGLDGGMGLAYFIGNNLILEAGLANFSYKNFIFPNSDIKYNEMSGGLTFSPNFTVNYVIKGGKK